MSKITTTKIFRKFNPDKIVDTARHYEYAEYRGVKFPVLMSAGQIMNIKKAYERYVKNK